jgi:tRNA dimethylallyltransferase
LTLQAVLSLVGRTSATSPILIAGTTASGKSALAITLAERLDGVVINADASQVYACWRILTARPSKDDEARVPHRLYGHIGWRDSYSTGHWLRDVTPLLQGPRRPIIVGGTGLYFSALTEGLSEIPETPASIRATADDMSLPDLLSGISAETASRLDQANRARVQRAWEVEHATGRPLHVWQQTRSPPVLPLTEAVPILLQTDRDWAERRIRQRFDGMLDGGALDEVRAMAALFDLAYPSCRAIGARELMSYVTGDISLDEAREKVAIATRQYAKRQRTWFRSRMANWQAISWP